MPVNSVANDASAFFISLPRSWKEKGYWKKPCCPVLQQLVDTGKITQIAAEVEENGDVLVDRFGRAEHVVSAHLGHDHVENAEVDENVLASCPDSEFVIDNKDCLCEKSADCAMMSLTSTGYFYLLRPREGEALFPQRGASFCGIMDHGYRLVIGVELFGHPLIPG